MCAGNQSGLPATDLVPGSRTARKPLLVMELDNLVRFQHYTFNSAGEARRAERRHVATGLEVRRRRC